MVHNTLVQNSTITTDVVSSSVGTLFFILALILNLAQPGTGILVYKSNIKQYFKYEFYS